MGWDLPFTNDCGLSVLRLADHLETLCMAGMAKNQLNFPECPLVKAGFKIQLLGILRLKIKYCFTAAEVCRHRGVLVRYQPYPINFAEAKR